MPSNNAESRIHDDKDRFVAAIQYTAAERGFSAPLIEKDYFCSLVLAEISELFDGGLVFKGGTSLSKIHNDFYRLSEDLDFMISVRPDALPAELRNMIRAPKAYVLDMSARLPCIIVPAKWNDTEAGGRHHSIQLAYQSHITGEPGKIKFEISLRGKIHTSVEQAGARTLLLDPTTQAPALGDISVKALSLHETYAEKVCAALTRRELAIRDFYDLHHALEKGLIDLEDEALLTLTRLKVTAPNSYPLNEDPERLSRLTSQLEGELRPVLLPEDFSQFDVERIFGKLTSVAEAIRSPKNESR